MNNIKLANLGTILNPSPSLSRISLNRTADSSEILEYDVNTVWKAIVSEKENKRKEFTFKYLIYPVANKYKTSVFYKMNIIINTMFILPLTKPPAFSSSAVTLSINSTSVICNPR